MFLSGQKTVWNSTAGAFSKVSYTYDSNYLVGQMEAKLEIWECFIGLAAVYVIFMTLALIGLKISSRRV